MEEIVELGVALTSYRVADALYRKMNPTSEVAPTLHRESTFQELEGHNIESGGQPGFHADIPQGVLEVYACGARAPYQPVTRFRVVVQPHNEQWFSQKDFKRALAEVTAALGPTRSSRGRA